MQRPIETLGQSTADGIEYVEASSNRSRQERQDEQNAGGPDPANGETPDLR